MTPAWRPTSAQGTGKSHQLAADVENVVMRANCPCSKSDSTQWCQEAATCTEVRPCEHGKTARANAEKADAARSCGVYRHRHVYNAHVRNVTGPPGVSHGSGSTNVFTDQYTRLASELVTKHDGGVWSSQSSGTRSARACIMK